MEKNFSLRELNTFGFDVKARYFQELKTMEDIRELIANPEFIECRDAIRVLILSGGSNILFSSEFFDGFVVYPNLKGIETLEENAETVKIRCNCGEVWKNFVDYTVSKGLYGLENLADIPGKVGAAPVQNIGAYGAEVKDTVCQVHTIDLATGKTKVFSNEECHFSYRNSVFKKFGVWSLKCEVFPLIFAVDFILKKHGELKLDYGNIRNYLIANNITNPTIQDVASTVKAIRAEKLPEVGVVGSVGSFFQNAIVSVDKYQEIKALYSDVPSYPVEIPPLPSVGRNDSVSSPAMVKIPTGWLIDRAGWKGHRENHVGVWDKQALVLVHYGGGKPQEILDLMKKIQESVNDKFGIEIKPEVNII
ncbi:MAG: UDP-N-acetylmuramate dehydrogenase [Bacteroidales bacterium]|nr:UDP-N-acetylmuramate dehydrogenase [Bacteroidales bacterium]